MGKLSNQWRDASPGDLWPGSWPDATQESLLRAALWSGRRGLAAWNEWQTRVAASGAIDAESQTILPLLYRNLRHQEIEAPELEPLETIYARTRAENEIKLQEGAEVVATLRGRGIQTLLLKGAPLLILHYRDVGPRPMADFDVAVPSDQARASLELLQKAGWQPGKQVTSATLRFRHSAGLYRVGRSPLDLHWRVFYESCGWVGDRPFWRDAVPLEVAGTHTLAPRAADLFLHTVIHGMRQPEPSLRWIADAVTLLNGTRERFEWDRLLELAGTYRVSVRLAIALKYLVAQFDVGVPDAIREQFSRPREGSLERAEIWARQRRPWLSRLSGVAIDYSRIQAGKPRGAWIRDLFSYAVLRWRLRDRRPLVPVRNPAPSS